MVFVVKQERCPGLYVSVRVAKRKRKDLVQYSRLRDGAVELLWWDEVGFDGSVILPDSVYAVIAVARKSLTWAGGGFLALGGGGRSGGGRNALADGGHVTVEEGIEAFWQDAPSGTCQGSIKGGAGQRIEGYHLLYHGLSRSEFGLMESERLTRMP